MIRAFSILLVCCSLATIGLAAVTVGQLQVNYETTPLGMDETPVRFSWQMHSDTPERGLMQEAYQITVRDERNAVVWDSGKQASATSMGVTYAGAPLQPSTRYTWEVAVWANNGQNAKQSSWFETGLMNPGMNAWAPATWIGGSDEDMVLYAHYLSVFKVQYRLQLDEATRSTKAAFVLGANDSRLMQKDLNLNGMANGKNESYVAIELDISGLEGNSPAQLHFYRVGYAPEDQAWKPFHSFDIPAAVINKDNRYDAHQFYLESLFGMIEIHIDGQDEAHKITHVTGNGFGRQGLNLNPYGAGGDFVCFPHLADIGFRLPAGQVARFADLEIRNYRTPSNILFSEDLSMAANYKGIFRQKDNCRVAGNSYIVEAGEEATLLLVDPSRNAAPMLRTEFEARNMPIRKARLYVTARGIYEIYLNGQRISNDYFNPGLTQYNKTHLYQTYDVGHLVQPGQDNALGAWLSEGWWSGNITFRGENWNFFGDRQSLLAKLVITYEDGSTATVATQAQDWQLYTDGPVRYGSFFQGEVYDATREAAIEGWNRPGFDASGWKKAVEVPLEGTGVVGTVPNFMGQPVTLDYSNQQLIGQIGTNVAPVMTRPAQSVEEVRPGVFVYDMGQNMVGVPRVQLQNGKAGHTIRMRYAEVRYPDLSEYAPNTGMIMLENIRAALAQDLFVLKGGAQTLQPRFTFHGYRFLEITGIDAALPLEAVQGVVLSSVPGLASHFETSNPLVNKLWENITWSLRGNFLSIPTDTPARNERMGWNGDINVFSRAATWLAHSNQFLKRHLIALRDMQADNGRFSDVAPVGNGFGGTLWGSAGIVVPWEMWQQYGDTSVLAAHYEAMNDYVAFLASKQNADGVLIEGPLGDWLSPENSKNDNTMLWTAYQIYNLDIMEQAAKILGKATDAERFAAKAKERRAFFNAVYVDVATHKTVHSGVAAPGFGPPPANPPQKGDMVDTQASYGIPLALNVFDDNHKKAALEHLIAAIKRANVDDLGVERPPYSLMTGFIGTASIGDALSGNGLHEVAYRLLQSENYPSWLYPVKNGATTIWERLNSYTIEDGFGGNNSMNSFNHYSFGAIASWMYNFSLGIQRDPAHPGFQHFSLKPTPDPTGQMTFAKGYYDAQYGRIVSEWYTQPDGGTRYVVQVPPNTSATIYLKATSGKAIRESGGKLAKANGVQLKAAEGGFVVLELASGSYEFMVK